MSATGAVSYLAATILFLVLSLLLVTSWRGRLQGALLVVAVLASLVWSALLASASWTGGYPGLGWLFASETVRDAAWLIFISHLLCHLLRTRMPVVFKIALYGGLAGVTVSAFGLALFSSVNKTPLFYETGVLLLMSLAGLALVEQLYRNSTDRQRWALKYLCIGLAGMFAYDVLIYSYVILFHQIDINLWNARGAINALLVPLLALSAARNADWTLDVFVSRKMVFYSTSLIAVGIYLLAMAFGGYYIRLYGGDWGTFAEAVFLFAALMGLMVIVFSGTVRAKIRVFLSKHFFNYRYDYREEWLRLITTLSTENTELDLPTRCIKAMAQIVECPGGRLWLRRDNSYRFVTHWNMTYSGTDQIPVDADLISYLAKGTAILDLSLNDGGKAASEELEIPEWLSQKPRAAVVVPLMAPDGLFGFIVLAAPHAARQFNWEDTDLLLTVGRQLASYLGQYENDRQLSEARQFDAFNRLSAFVMHDFKNILAQLSMILQNSDRHKNNPAFVDDVLATVDNSAKRMRRLLDQLTSGDTVGTRQRLRVTDAVARSVGECSNRLPVPVITGESDNETGVLIDPDRFANVLSHVIRNAQDATGREGSVEVDISYSDNWVRITVIDDGAGMEDEFVREKLFQPFYTTKASKGMGVGAYQTKELVVAAGGRVEVKSEPGSGTEFSIYLPAGMTSLQQDDTEVVLHS